MPGRCFENGNWRMTESVRGRISMVSKCGNQRLRYRGSGMQVTFTLDIVNGRDCRLRPCDYRAKWSKQERNSSKVRPQSRGAFVLPLDFTVASSSVWWIAS